MVFMVLGNMECVRHPADSDGHPTAGAQVLDIRTTWAGAALQSAASALRAVNLQATGTFLQLLNETRVTLLSVELLSCLVLPQVMGIAKVFKITQQVENAQEMQIPGDRIQQ